MVMVRRLWRLAANISLLFRAWNLLLRQSWRQVLSRSDEWAFLRPESHEAVFCKEEKCDLKRLFDSLGTDKGTHHGYHAIYCGFFSTMRESVRRLVEVGIGSKNEKVPQNMGPNYRSGASLYAWQSFFSNAHIIGLDIDSECLVQDKRISSYVFDQLSAKKSIKQLPIDSLESVEILIVDGLHNCFADFSTLQVFIENINPKVVGFIEDISSLNYYLFWVPAKLLLSKTHEISIYECNHKRLARVKIRQAL